MTTNPDPAKNLMDSYTQVLKIWQAQNDNNFKRIQLFMAVIQASLFLAALHAFSSAKYIIPIFLAVPGGISAFVWTRLHKRQRQFVEFCRHYLRDLEARLGSLGIPLEYFTAEALIFSEHAAQENLPKTLTISPVQYKGAQRNIAHFPKSGETYPLQHEKNNKHHSLAAVQTTGGIAEYEGSLAIGAIVIWIIIAIVAVIAFILALQPTPSIPYHNI